MGIPLPQNWQIYKYHSPRHTHVPTHKHTPKIFLGDTLCSNGHVNCKEQSEGFQEPMVQKLWKSKLIQWLWLRDKIKTGWGYSFCKTCCFAVASQELAKTVQRASFFYWSPRSCWGNASQDYNVLPKPGIKLLFISFPDRKYSFPWLSFLFFYYVKLSKIWSIQKSFEVYLLSI